MFQNISNEVLVAASNNQAKNGSENCIQRGGQLCTLPLSRKSLGTLGMRESTVLAVSYLVYYDTLLQNATSITCDKVLL